MSRETEMQSASHYFSSSKYANESGYNPSFTNIGVVSDGAELDFDYIFVFERDNEGEDDSQFLSKVCEKTNDVFGRRHALSRAKVIAIFQRLGLKCTLFGGTTKTTLFLGITADESVLLEYAEKFKLNIRLHKRYGGSYANFEMSRMQYFEPYCETSFFSSGVRSEIIRKVIESPVGNGGAGLVFSHLLKSEIVKSIFPVHEEEFRKKLLADWAKNWKYQPIDEIRQYFGEKIAIYFAWLGSYNTWLFLASVVGLIIFIITERDQFDSPVVPFYCIFLSLWSTLFLEYWKRYNSELCFRWGTITYEDEEEERPEFRGSLKRGTYVKGVWVDLADEAKWGPNVPMSLHQDNIQSSHGLRIILVSPLIILMVSVVVAATIGLMITRRILQNIQPFWGGQLAGVINAISILILNIVYKKLAFIINDWENHRTETEYEDNLITKTFLFQFVNSYISLFYIAYIKPEQLIHGDSCLGSCMEELTSQVSSIMIFRQLSGQFMEVMLPYIISRIKLLLRSFNYQEDVASKPNRFEEQYMLGEYESLFDDYNEMIIQYGYVTLFAAAFPLAPAIALINNIAEIRVDAFKLLTEFRRPEYRRAQDIGTWFKILEVMGIIAVFTNCLIISITSDQLPNLMEDSNKRDVLFVAVAIEHGILILKYLIAWLIPDVPDWVNKKVAEEEYAKVHLANIMFPSADDKQTLVVSEQEVQMAATMRAFAIKTE